MDHIDQPTAEHLASYWAGECTTEEAARVSAWIESNPEGAELVGRLQSIWEASSKAPVRDDADAFVGNLVSVWKTSDRTIGRSPRKWGLSAGVLGACLIAFVISVWGYTHHGLTRESYREFTTTPAQRAVINLPDGSVAMLAPATRIRYSSSFGKTNRGIEIEGQALFTVVNSSGRAFTVKTSGATTRVLGTSFTVRKYSGDSATTVVVAEGKVSVAALSSSAILTSGEKASINSGKINRYSNANISSAFAWTRGRLEFDDTPLRDVTADISRMYALDIRITSESLANQLFTGAVDNLSPNDAVAMLAAAFSVKVERRGNTFIISER